MSLAARNALYFQYAIAARFRLSPAPSSAQEASHLLRYFQSIAPVDYFHVQQAKFASHSPFKQIVSVVFNSSEQPSQLDPFSGVNPASNATPAQLEQRQHELMAYIRRICGLPRYSYIENDQMYSDGKFMVPFKHKLLAEGHHLLGEYEISASMVNEPFFVVTGKHEAKDVLPFVRHNFQRLHKIEPIFMEPGPAGLQRLMGKAMDAEVSVNMNHVIDMAAVMDLDEELPITAEKYSDGGRFRGFWS